MASRQILVVEDESIVAMDLQYKLQDLGYSVPYVTRSGEGALERVAESKPDLVLMDIRLDGAMDGIEAAGHIRDRFGIPIIYLTAHADEDTLKRAKVTEPIGYVLKPINEGALRTAIETALYKHGMDKSRSVERERWLSAVLSSTADAVITFDNDGSVTFMNPVAEVLSGLHQDDALGKSLAEVLTITDSSSGIAAGEFVREAMRERTVVHLADQTTVIARSGTAMPIDGSFAPITDGEGNGAGGVLTFGVVLTFRDMTERERLKNQLLQAQKMEAVGQLAGGVAHDFNNMLTAILGYCQLGMSKVAPEDQVSEYLQEIQKAGEQASHLTRQLLAFSRHQVKEPRLLNPNDLIIDADKMMRWLTGEGIELIALPESRGLVEVDPDQMQQVLINLVANARDALPSGGKVTINTADVSFDDENGAGAPDPAIAGQVMLAVSDNGIGMTEEVVARVFEPFFTTKELGKGTGLGLSTCHGIVAQNRGHITVESDPGKGTTFKIFLPQAEGTIDSQQALEEPAARLTDNMTVLLVEDEPMVRAVSSQALREQGYSVIEATNGSEALKLATDRATEKVDVLVTDVVMPLVGGAELAERIWADRPEMKVLFTSGYMDDNRINPDELRPGSAFLQKPFTPAVLSTKVSEVLLG